jgi:hypothetical protein
VIKWRFNDTGLGQCPRKQHARDVPSADLNLALACQSPEFTLNSIPCCKKERDIIGDSKIGWDRHRLTNPVSCKRFGDDRHHIPLQIRQLGVWRWRGNGDLRIE